VTKKLLNILLRQSQFATLCRLSSGLEVATCFSSINVAAVTAIATLLSLEMS
jgi:hypothetical protein